MNLDTAEDPVKVVLDTSVLISALVYGGKPKQLLDLTLNQKITTFISPPILAELVDVLLRKFRYSRRRAQAQERKVKESFKVVYPTLSVSILSDEPDNRVLEAALTAEAEFIVTGDKELLNLRSFRGIKILNPTDFLEASVNTKTDHDRGVKT